MFRTRVSSSYNFDMGPGWTHANSSAPPSSDTPLSLLPFQQACSLAVSLSIIHCRPFTNAHAQTHTCPDTQTHTHTNSCNTHLVLAPTFLVHTPIFFSKQPCVALLLILSLSGPKLYLSILFLLCIALIEVWEPFSLKNSYKLRVPFEPGCNLFSKEQHNKRTMNNERNCSNSLSWTIHLNRVSHWLSRSLRKKW